ncbi:MAG TPA: hypothetical protein VKF36_14265 [Syntrophorhabdales bacterium]|nr:hypothetical protein [Syntrophorhabdales bacterium]
MGNKEDIKANTFEKILMAKKASARNMTGTEDLLSAMSATSNQDTEAETEKPRKAHKTRWLQILVACCCILIIAAAGIDFLYVNSEISAVQSAVGSAVKDLDTLKAQLAVTDVRKQLTAVTAEVEDLKATNTQLRAEVKEMRDTLEALKARKNGVVPAPQKRR